MNYIAKICKASNSVFNMIPNFEGNIYHYCPDEAAKGILTNSTLRFTDRRFQTDTDEAVFPLSVCLKNINKLIDSSYFDDLEVGNHFVECFKTECEARIKSPYSGGFYTFQSCYTTTDKSSYLWREFAANGGYRLKFNSVDLLAKFKLQNIGSEQRILHGLVIYDEDKQVALMKDLISNFLTLDLKSDIIKRYKFQKEPMLHKLLVDRIMLLGTFMVKPKFESELEYKFVLDLHKDFEDGKFTTIQNELNTYKRPGSSTEIPFLDVSFEPSALKGVSIEREDELEERKDAILSWGKTHFSDILDEIHIDVSQHAFSI